VAIDQKSVFTAALDALVAQVKKDRSILAAILCGSLSHDAVWEKSDIDLVLVTVDDAKAPGCSMALYANGVNVHANLVSRADFRKTVEGSLQNSFMHSLLAKGRLLYTHDETVATLCERLHALGARDREIQILRVGTGALASLYKAHKFLITRGDLDYTALWILSTADAIARIEVLSAGLLADREVIPQAMKLNPALFDVIYRDLLNAKKTRTRVEAAVTALDDYMASRARTMFGPILDYLREAGEARSCAEVDDYFARHLDVGYASAACEYLADQGLVGKVSLPARLTKKSNVDVQELAFVYLTASSAASKAMIEEEWKPD
jgi:hypothetical protein